MYRDYGAPVTVIDGIEKILINPMTLQQAQADGKFTGVEVSCYYKDEESNPDLRKIFRIICQKEDGRTFRIVYVDSICDIYLMNNEGKTIERIN